MKLKVFISALFILVGPKAFALYGSSPTQSGTAKYLVYLHLQDADEPKYDLFCQGVLVAPNKVLTTAHCIDSMSEHVYSAPSRLVYRPDLVVIKAQGERVRAKSITLAPTYFNDHGLAGEDLALIELTKPLTLSTPIAFASKADFKTGVALTLVSQNQVAQTNLKSVNTHGEAVVLKTDGSLSGVCEGDSGGALVLKKNNQAYLAGILIATNLGCPKKDSTSYAPKLNF